MGIRRKIAPLKLFCRISRLEHAILFFIGGQGGMATAVRRMIFHYVKTSPDFDLKSFEAFVREEVLPDLGEQGTKDLEFDLKILRDKLETTDEDARTPLIDAKGLAGFFGKGED